MRPADLLWGALLPPLGFGAAAAMLLAAVQPPLGALTGLGRWDVFAPFAAAGVALNLWLAALIPSLPICLVALRAGRFGWGGAALCAVAATVALTAAAALVASGGRSLDAFLSEVLGWWKLFGGACVLAVGAMRLGAGIAAARRADGQAARRDLASRA